MSYLRNCRVGSTSKDEISLFLRSFPVWKLHMKVGTALFPSKEFDDDA